MSRENAKKKLSVAEKLVEGLEEFADSLEAGEDIAQRFNCHKVVLDLQPTPYDRELVKATRKQLCASQTIFAHFLGVSVQSVRAWEQGNKEPRDIACRFMDEIRSNPAYWRARLRQLVKPKASTATA